MTQPTTPTKLGEAAERQASAETTFPTKSSGWTRETLMMALESGEMPFGKDGGRSQFAFTKALKFYLGWAGKYGGLLGTEWLENPPGADDWVAHLRCPSTDIKAAMLSSNTIIDITLNNDDDDAGWGLYIIDDGGFDFGKEEIEMPNFKSKAAAVEALPRAICLAILKGGE